MIGLRKYDNEKLEKLIENKNKIQLSYEDIGLAKRQQSPPNYHTNSYSTKIGQGRKVYEHAQQIITDLDHLQFNWISCHTSTDKLGLGTFISIQSRLLGLRGLAISQIIEIIDREDSNTIEYGYVMGTTHYHIVRGEEAFIIKYEKDTGIVTYTIYSYSKTNGLLVTLASPLIRNKQRQFVRSAANYLQSQVQQEEEEYFN